MKVEKICSKFIKPCSPTPPNLKNYNISFVDSFIAPVNIAVVLFYESKPENSCDLEESLAKILVQFYPVAGRFTDTDQTLDCSDQGVEFVEAQALDVKLIDLFGKMEVEQINGLLPDQYFRPVKAAADPVMSIQATHFLSGGLAIAISVCHRVFDVASIETFVAAWCNATNPSSLDSFTPVSFDLSRLIPNKEKHLHIGSNVFSDKKPKIVVKRLLFDSNALEKLKSILNPNQSRRPISRVRAVCGVIAKALIDLDRVKLGRNRDFVIVQAINMRERTILPVPKHTCGNFAIMSLTRGVAASETGLQEVVDGIGDSVRKDLTEYAEIVCPNRDGRDIVMNSFEKYMKEVWGSDMNPIIFSDWSKFGFYEADFGWGKPVWISAQTLRSSVSTTILTSNKEGDGIEAWVYLKEDDMSYFEENEEIKLYTT